jgi:hypothetical protein
MISVAHELTKDCALDTRDSDRLYEQYGKPLESSHRGRYVGVSMDGEVVFASTLVDAVRRAVDTFGKDSSIVFRVGDKVVGRVR